MQSKLITFIPSNSKGEKVKKVEFKPFINTKNKSTRNIKIEGKRKKLWD